MLELPYGLFVSTAVPSRQLSFDLSACWVLYFDARFLRHD